MITLHPRRCSAVGTLAQMNDRLVREPTADDVLAAADLIARYLPVTPVLASPLLGRRAMLKVETFQPTGSFKVRGALTAVAAAVARDPRGRVVTASAGNHGLGVAFAAQLLGARATIVLPENASTAKWAALERFDVDLVAHGTSYEEAEAHALDLAGAGSWFVSAYNDPDVIAGQGTIALELFAQAPDVETIVAPTGGGGLLAGLCLAASTRPGVKVCGVEADASPAVSASVAAGHVVEVSVGPTLADGLAGNLEAGSVTVPIIARLVDQLVRVDEGAMGEAVRFLAFQHGLVAEPSGAIGVGALSRGFVPPAEGSTVVVVTGRNLSRSLLSELLAGL
jgi:threonine dehydratase